MRDAFHKPWGLPTMPREGENNYNQGMKLYPTKIELVSPELLRITWNDERASEYAVKDLRDRCPCASCREKRKEASDPSELLPIISPADLQPPRIAGMKPVGNYAYCIEFGDGHDTGIFTLTFLQELAGIAPSTDETHK